MFRCLRVKQKNRPFSTRCKKTAERNGILCKECIKDSLKGVIHVLMHKDVTKKFGIPFKNQLCVAIDVTKRNDPPITKNEKVNKDKETRVFMLEQLSVLKLNRIKWFHDQLKLDIWKQLSENSNEYALRFHVSKAIVDKLVQLSI